MDIFNYDGSFGVFLNTATMACLLVYALSLWIQRDRTRAQIYLAITFFEVGMSVLLRYFVFDVYLDAGRGEFLHTFNLSATALGSVLILLYFTSLMHPQRITRRYVALWFSAVSAFAVLLLGADLTLGEAAAGLGDAVEHAGQPAVLVRFVGGGVMALFAGYVACAVITMNIRHRQFIRQCYSYEERIDLRWVTVSIACFGVFALIALVRHTHASHAMKILFNAGTLLTMTCIYVFGFRQGKIPVIDDLAEMQMKNEDVETPALSIKSTRRRQERDKLIEEKLTGYFTEQKPYLNPELSLSDVAAAIGVNTTYLSQFFNRRYETNFFTFVNGYRIDFAIRLIHERQGNIASEMIYTESGFKSRSVFYKLFHSRTGCTPQAYIRKMEERGFSKT